MLLTFYFIAFHFHCIAMSALKVHRIVLLRATCPWYIHIFSSLYRTYSDTKKLRCSHVCALLGCIFSFIISKCWISYFSKIFQINIFINLHFSLKFWGMGNQKQKLSLLSQRSLIIMNDFQIHWLFLVSSFLTSS